MASSAPASSWASLVGRSGEWFVDRLSSHSLVLKAARPRAADGVEIDRATKTVYRINLKTGAATPVVRNGTKNKAGTVANPRFLAVGGQDLPILDSKNVLWRWRPADEFILH